MNHICKSDFLTSNHDAHDMIGTPTPERFRSAMGSFASGVTIVTAGDSGVPAGITANAFSSVSLDPPLILVCIDRRSRSAEILRRTAHFAVHILSENERDVAMTFARRGEGKFETVDWHWADNGVPVLDHCLVRLSCTMETAYEGGDHLIFMGAVDQLDLVSPEAEPLTCYQGRLGALSLNSAND